LSAAVVSSATATAHGTIADESAGSDEEEEEPELGERKSRREIARSFADVAPPRRAAAALAPALPPNP